MDSDVHVGDSTVQTVGATLPGVSPRNLLSTGLADWIIASDPASLGASVSGKDRGAILPAAHAKGQVYWFEPAGGFVTSTYYRASSPDWVVRFNNEVVPRYMADRSAHRLASVSLSSPNRRVRSDGIHTISAPSLRRHALATRQLRAWMSARPSPTPRTRLRQRWSPSSGSAAMGHRSSAGLRVADDPSSRFGPSAQQLDNPTASPPPWRLLRLPRSHVRRTSKNVGSARHGVHTAEYPRRPRSRRLRCDVRHAAVDAATARRTAMRHPHCAGLKTQRRSSRLDAPRTSCADSVGLVRRDDAAVDVSRPRWRIVQPRWRRGLVPLGGPQQRANGNDARLAVLVRSPRAHHLHGPRCSRGPCRGSGIDGRLRSHAGGLFADSVPQ